ncbi:hypothetical protein B0T13DRAFT_454825 [Neurospora crassa]|nr:hypothetical protein B0T13DRAFT_454825 [Neurospora crassa]
MGTPLVPNRAFASSHLFLFSQSEDGSVGAGNPPAGPPSPSLPTSSTTSSNQRSRT